MSDNLYAAPSADVAVSADSSLAAAEDMRNAHLSHEASIRGVGALYLLSSVLMFFGFAGMGVAYLGGSAGAKDMPFGTWAGVLIVLICFVAIAQFWTGLGLRRLDRRVKITAIILAVLGLFSIPIGTILGIYVMYLLLSAKGKIVLSDEYVQVRELTPHLKYRTSMVIWILLGLVVLGIIAAVAIPAFSTV